MDQNGLPKNLKLELLESKKLNLFGVNFHGIMPMLEEGGHEKDSLRYI